jgi:D-alanyl-D-alanine endopeptidase (penicillin-binding protein 7)
LRAGVTGVVIVLAAALFYVADRRAGAAASRVTQASTVAMALGTGRGQPPAAPVPERPPMWVPPSWMPEDADLLALPEAMGVRGPRRGPSVRSRYVYVYDLDSDEVLFERNADAVRPVASLTKLVASLAMVRAGGNLETNFCVGAAQYPTRPGARSRLSTGDCVQGWDVLGAALVASDNRAALGLAAVADLDVDAFVEQMNAVSEELAMDHSTWSDPSGLEDDNLSTARDIARATVAVAAHPTLSLVASAPMWDLHREKASGDVPRRLFSTNRLSGRPDMEFFAAKTGYTDTARYNFSTVLRTASGRRLVIALLGAEGKQTRFADVERILDWVEGLG